MSTLSETANVLVPNRRILDKRFVSQVVTEPVKEFRVSSSSGIKHDDNVTGNLVALDVRTESNEILNLVVKSVLPMMGPIDKKMLSRARLTSEQKKFQNEICYYKQIRPLFKELIQREDKLMQSLFSRISFFSSIPKYYSSVVDSTGEGLHDYVALEDLRPCGYKIANKFKGLSFDQVTTVLKEIALFHAVTYCLLRSPSQEIGSIQKDIQSTFNNHVWIGGPNDQRAHYTSIVTKISDVFKENGDEALAKQIQEFSQEGHKTILDLWKKTSEDGKYFRVLIHGDLWAGNILFKPSAFDGGTGNKSVEEVKLIDFQNCRFGNIYEDLLYFIFTSTTGEFREAYLKPCLHLYFQEFSKVLEQLKTPLPGGFTEQELVETFYQHVDYGVSCSLVAIPAQLGLQPPPESPMTPLEFDLSNGFFPTSSGQGTFEQSSGSGDFNDFNGKTQICFQQILNDSAEALKIGVRNSPIANKRLKEVLAEL